jgi:CheY-like chemotaxis protein
LLARVFRVCLHSRELSILVAMGERPARMIRVGLLHIGYSAVCLRESACGRGRPARAQAGFLLSRWDILGPMSTLVNESMVARLFETARQKVADGMASIGKPTPESALRLAMDLHTIAGEAAMLDKPDLSKSAAEGEEAARRLASGKSDALVACMRSLRRLGYLLQGGSEAGEPKPNAASKAEAPTVSHRLLVVDDSPVAALALADVFEMHDFRVRSVSTMEEALKQFSQFSPTVLVSDVHMPNLDVAELCRRFRETALGRKAIVVLVSGRTESELRNRLAEIKPDAFVSKLSGAAEVVARVGAVCRELLA